MDRVKINVSNLKKPRFDKEDFSFTDKEKKALSSELNKIEAMTSEKSEVIFSVSKYEGLFKGSLKIDSHGIFTYGKDFSATALFNKLRARVEKNILAKNQNHAEKENDLLNIAVPKNTKTMICFQ